MMLVFAAEYRFVCEDTSAHIPWNELQFRRAI